MVVESCRAIVLRTVEYKDSSSIATLLTAESGRVDCIAKGCRRPKSRFASAIQPFNVVDVVYHHRSTRSIQTLTEAQLVREFRKIRNNMRRFAYASYVTQVIGAFAQVGQPAAELFNLLLRALDETDSSEGDLRMLAAAVALRTVRATGFGMQLGPSCVRCGRPFGERPFLDFAAGGAACGDCGGDGPSISTDEIMELDRLARSSAQAVARMEVTEATASRLLGLVNRYVMYVLERDLPSWRFIESMTTSARHPGGFQ